MIISTLYYIQNRTSLQYRLSIARVNSSLPSDDRFVQLRQDGSREDSVDCLWDRKRTQSEDSSCFSWVLVHPAHRSTGRWRFTSTGLLITGHSGVWQLLRWLAQLVYQRISDPKRSEVKFDLLSEKSINLSVAAPLARSRSARFSCI